MKYISLLLVAISLAPLSSKAQQSNGFSCEKIKEKSVRIACIDERVKAAKEKAFEEEYKALIEKQKQAEIGRAAAKKAAQKKELDDFVVTSKKFLTKSFKDPLSVQYRDVFILQTDKLGNAMLCGSLNSKNSYGGYNGFKYFYVVWESSTDTLGENSAPVIEWLQEENSEYRKYLEAYLAIDDFIKGDKEKTKQSARESEIRIYERQCTPRSNQTQIKIPD